MYVHIYIHTYIHIELWRREMTYFSFVHGFQSLPIPSVVIAMNSDTAPFSAPLSVKLLKELLIVSFTSFPFPPHHSTETILVSVISGPVVTISSGQYSALFLIDPSAALDTICHFFPLP